MEDFSSEPAEVWAGEEEERRGEAFDNLQFYIGKDPSLLPYLPTCYLEAITKAQPRG